MSTDRSNVTPLRIADATRGVRHVFVRDLCLEADIGVHAHEMQGKQPIRLNIDLTVHDRDIVVADTLANVVDYETVVRKIEALVARGHVKLVETLAELIAQDCLHDERVLGVRVRIEKLRAIAKAASVGVEIERHRQA